MSQLQFEFVDASSIEAEFDAFSAECVSACDEQIRADHVIGRKLVRAYLWYRRLDTDRPLFKKLYIREGLDPSLIESTPPDFSAFATLAFRIGLRRTEQDRLRYASTNSPSRRNKKSGYAAALERLHSEYATNQHLYSHDAVERLLAWHLNQGAIDGARDWRAERNGGSAARSAAPTSVHANDQRPDEDQARNWIEQNALSIVGGAPVVARGRAIYPGRIAFDAGGFGLAIARRGGSGRIEYLDVANDNELAALAGRLAGNPRYTQSRPLRALAEIAATQRFPKSEKSGSRLDPNSSFRLWEARILQEKGKGGIAERNLLFLPDAIVLSPSRLKAGLVTRFVPDKPVWHGTACAYAGVETIRWFEHQLDEETLSAYSSYPEQRFFAHPNGVFASSVSTTHALLVKSRAAGAKPRPILLSDISSRGSSQPDLNLDNYRPAWKFTAGKTWFRAAQQTFFNEWFKEQVGGNRLKRPVNRLFRLSATAQELAIEHQIGAAGAGLTDKLDLGLNGAASASILTQSSKISVSTKDLGPLFYTISELDLVGGVEISADEHVLVFQFKTEIGQYMIGVPAATITKSGVDRDSTHFSSV